MLAYYFTPMNADDTQSKVFGEYIDNLAIRYEGQLEQEGEIIDSERPGGKKKIELQSASVLPKPVSENLSKAGNMA